MLIGAPYSVSGITFLFSCSKTPKLKQIKVLNLSDLSKLWYERECETKVRQSKCLHGVPSDLRNLLLRNLSETSGLQRFQ